MRLLLTVFAALFFAAHAHGSTTPCNAAFAPETGKSVGWQGADAAYSIPLPDGRDVWIFGDTLYGTHRVVDGNNPLMVHNSLGISTCSGGHWKLRYSLRHDAKGNPLSFFSPADPAHWYWALDGFYANGDLWVTLLCIRHPAASAPAGMDFETCGSDLAQISGLDRDPEHWQVTVHPLVPDGVKAYPSATTVVHDGYAYLFASYENGAHCWSRASRSPALTILPPTSNTWATMTPGTLASTPPMQNKSCRKGAPNSPSAITQS